ncbi:MAG: hypothetical protein ACYTGP_02955 [Planctomycetota bacterium]
MSVNPLASGSAAAMLAGVRTELRAETMRQAFGSAEVLDANLAEGLDALSDAARSLTRAGHEALRSDVVGTLIDILA